MSASLFMRTIMIMTGALLMSNVSIADDTEIFFNTSSASTIKPNILFIIDNSGSMDSKVTTTTVYDNSVAYSGDASTDNIYFRKSGSFYKIPKTNNKCNDILSRLTSYGMATSYRMARWYSDKKRWRNLTDANVSVTTECESDAGLHGVDAASADKYARNHANMWGNESNEIDWGNIDFNNFYSANYVNWYENHRDATTRTRLQIVQEVSKNLADSMSNVNIGLMVFNVDGGQDEGGRMLVSVGDIEQNRDTFKAAVDTLTPFTWTPLSETLFEAMRYYQGGDPFLDKDPVIALDASGKYTTPITSDCQSSAIVLLTDGEPTEDGNHNGTMDDVVGACTGNCLDEIAEYLHTKDQCSLTGTQTVTVYTVGFESDQVLLSDAARKGGGKYYLADDAESLEDAFTSIVRSVLQVNATFVSPGIAVNTFNRLNHLDALYFSVFQPETVPSWSGNLKRYRLSSDGVVMDNSSPAINAVDPNSGFFKSTARSWWLEDSDQADGFDVDIGGASGRHPDTNANRKVFTHYPGSSSDVLSNSVNAVTVANKANLTKTMFGNASMTDTEHENLINWTRGADVFNITGNGVTASRKYIADPLHSVPQLTIYGGTANSPDVTIYFGDNQGYLHAVDGATGDSYFSFIPSELLVNQPTLMANDEAVTNRPYGLDGSPTSWIKDDGDGQIASGDGDHVRIYTGMRRGGRNYYALDVTDRANPEWLWTIYGGTGDFLELGQTWSKPVKTKVTIQNSQKDVLIFAGGYDTQQDTLTVRAVDTVGRAVYMVDANTGALLWWAGPTGSGATLTLADMKYSIPSSPKVIDVTGDGFADQIYVGDMGGQVWRFDITNGNQARDLVTAGVIADFGGSTAASHRRFYHSPDLFGLKIGSTRYLGLVIGSGWHEHPLDTAVQDRIYMLRMTAVTGAPTIPVGGVDVVTYTKLTEANLYDTTDNLIGEGTDAQKTTALNSLTNAKGWYIRLTRSGEKVLSTSQTIGNQTFITTYEPTPNNAECVPSAGTPRLYHFNVKDGTPVVNYDDVGSDDNLTKSDRELVLKTPGLPPSPQRMRIDGKDIICVGAECLPVTSVTGIVETYWYED